MMHTCLFYVWKIEVLFMQQNSLKRLKLLSCQKVERDRMVSLYVPFKKFTTRSYTRHKHLALLLVQKKVAEWNAIYGFRVGKISVKNQKTRWGSCSKKGNLNFNYKILFLPEPLADYLVVHELCHLGEFNHSHKFWNLVAQTLPDYKARRVALKKIRI